jgi:hypothetical protein
VDQKEPHAKLQVFLLFLEIGVPETHKYRVRDDSERGERTEQRSSMPGAGHQDNVQAEYASQQI